MGKNFDMVDEIDGVIETYQEYFDEFAVSLTFIKDLSCNTGYEERVFLCDLIGAMLKERTDTLIDHINEFTCELKFVTRKLFENVTSEEVCHGT